MADIVVLIAKTPEDVKALAIVKGYTILSDIKTFDSLNKDAVIYSPPYFQPPLGHIQTGQTGAVALASA
jgi:hypothetical protein